jgi:hypothetical protein
MTMKKRKPKLKRLLLFLGLSLFLPLKLPAQDLLYSLLPYQFNTLPLNPAAAGSKETKAFDATYFGNFTSGNSISRNMQVSLHGRTAGGLNGLGGVAQFYREPAYGDLSIRPAYAHRISLPAGDIAFGASVGASYLDFDENRINTATNFAAMSGGLGVWFQATDAFAGVSVLNLFEKGFADANSEGNVVRESPVILHGGFGRRLNDQLALRPAALVKYASRYRILDHSDEPAYWSFDGQITLVVDENYYATLLYGRSIEQEAQGEAVARWGVSFAILLGDFRLTYAFQRNNFVETGVELPGSHLIGAGLNF